MAALFFMCTMTTFSAWAQSCKNYVKSGSQTIQVPAIEVNIPAFTIPEFNPEAFSDGATIFEHVGNDSAPGHSVCNVTATVWHTGNPSYGPVNPLLYDTYPTSMNGIGMRISRPNEGKTSPSATSLKLWSIGTNIYWNGAGDFKIELVKTGKITAPGKLGGEIMYYRIGRNGEIIVKYKLPPINVIPRVPTCSVANSYQLVELGQINTSAVGAAGQLPAKIMGFNIRLNCSGGDTGTATRAFVTLTDANQVNNSGKILTLQKTSQKPGEKLAEGVGIQIMKSDGTILGFGPASSATGNPNQWEAGKIDQAPGTTEFIIPLKAGYVKTGLPMKVGKVYAQAIFTMSYQ